MTFPGQKAQGTCFFTMSLPVSVPVWKVVGGGSLAFSLSGSVHAYSFVLHSEAQHTQRVEKDAYFNRTVQYD